MRIITPSSIIIEMAAGGLEKFTMKISTRLMPIVSQGIANGHTKDARIFLNLRTDFRQNFYIV